MLVGLRSRKHIPPFELVRPATVTEACRALATPGRNFAMAGGLDLIDRLKSGEAVDRIVLLGGVRELSTIARDGDFVSIGAMATHAQIAQSELLHDLLPDLPSVWRAIANPRVRFAGTLGGNLMSAAPHYDAWPALLALGAQAQIADSSGICSTVPLSALRGRTGILLTGVRIASERRWLLADRSMHPVVSVYLGAEVDGGIVRSLSIAVGCALAAAAVVVLPPQDVPVAAMGARAGDLARAVAGEVPEPTDDGLASAAYRRRMIEVLTRRLLIKLGTRA